MTNVAFISSPTWFLSFFFLFPSSLPHPSLFSFLPFCLKDANPLYLLHVLFEFSVAAITNVHKLGGLTPQKYILSEFWRAEI